MSAGKHTKGRLAWDGARRINAVDFCKVNERGYVEGLVALPYPCGEPGDPAWEPTENAEANARRIAACWNACVDVPTEVLEAEQAGGLSAPEKLGACPEHFETLRSALDHIARTARNSSTSTRRIRWIAARAQMALDGKPYSDAMFDLPKVDNSSPERRIHRLNERVRTAKKLLQEVVGLCAVGDIDETTDDGLGWAGFVRDAKAFLNPESEA